MSYSNHGDPRHFLALIACLAGGALPGIAWAQNDVTKTAALEPAPAAASPTDPATQPSEEESEVAATAGASRSEQPAARRHQEERPFAFVLDPTTPSRGDLSLEYSLGYASGTAADRPLPSTMGAPTGAEHALTLGYGITNRIAPSLSVRLLQPTNGEGSVQATGNVGLRFAITDPQSTGLRLTMSTVVFREFEGAMGASARAAMSYDLFKKLRLAGNVHLEHVFADNRDAVDVLVLAGASYAVLPILRVGVEYVGQDLEEMADDGEVAEGGAHHYVGPSVALSLIGEKLQLVAGGAVGLGAQSQPMVGRLAALMTF
jgi:hypothetical protein